MESRSRPSNVDDLSRESTTYGGRARRAYGRRGSNPPLRFGKLMMMAADSSTIRKRARALRKFRNAESVQPASVQLGQNHITGSTISSPHGVETARRGNLDRQRTVSSGTTSTIPVSLTVWKLLLLNCRCSFGNSLCGRLFPAASGNTHQGGPEH